MKRLFFLKIGALVICSLAVGQGGRDIGVRDAYSRLGQPATYLVDVRTVAEYVYVGHPEAAYNVPLVFWEEQKMRTVANVNFVEDIKARFKPSDTLILICRTGNRSALALRMLWRAGYQNVYNVREGFEGAKDRNGLPTLNGWKNEDLPYTYVLDPERVYRFEK
jgi:rhodanese-related sulfurtransferase